MSGKTKRQIGSVFEHFDMTFAGNGRRRTKIAFGYAAPLIRTSASSMGEPSPLPFGNFQRPAVNFVTLDNLFR